MTQTIEKRLEALELRHGDGGGCPRCTATLIIIRNIDGEFHSAKALPGGELSSEELTEREAEERCPRCGRELTGESSARGAVIKIGGRR